MIDIIASHHAFSFDSYSLHIIIGPHMLAFSIYVVFTSCVRDYILTWYDLSDLPGGVKAVWERVRRHLTG